ncbi:MAG: hypothetical protein HQL22_08340 [Candidatus Omnitrophica bacterium]|nr:hypothetical protein [Candidatus Omnitrophota bacterium]
MFFGTTLIACFWVAALLAAFVGWGRLINGVIYTEQEFSWGELAAWGVAFSTVIGGVLNLSQAISRQTAIMFVILGFVYFCMYFWRRVADVLINFPRKVFLLWRGDTISLLGLCIVGGLLIFQLALSIAGIRPNIYDDYQAYFVFPQKMLLQGCLGNDPFCDRRFGFLGGGAFLQVLLLSVLPIKNIFVMDYGLGCVIAIGLLFRLGHKMTGNRRMCILLAILFLLLPMPVLNISSAIMGLAIILSIYSFVVDDRKVGFSASVRRAIVIALLVAGVATLKSNLIVFITIFYLAMYAFKIFYSSDKLYLGLEFLMSFFLIILFLLPWMLASYHSTGTMLYPLLGRGFHSSAYGFFEFPPIRINDFFDVFSWKMASWPDLALMALLSCAAYQQAGIRKAFCGAAGLSTFAGIIAIIVLTHTPRYYAFVFYAGVLVMYCLVFSSFISLSGASFTKKVLYALICCFTLFIFRGFADQPPGSFLLYPHRVSENFGLEIDNNIEREIYFHAQAAVPPAETILAQTKMPFLFDFKRNNIYIVDWIGFGPKPGMPILKGSEAISDYLLSQGIKYVIFSDNMSFKFNPPVFPNNTWTYQQVNLTDIFYRSIYELSKKRRVISIYGNLVVLDLSARL